MQVNSPETIHDIISKDKEQFNVLTENFWSTKEFYNCNLTDLPLKIKNNPRNWMFGYEVYYERIETKVKYKVTGNFLTFKELKLRSKHDIFYLDDTDCLHLNEDVIFDSKDKKIYIKFKAYKFKTEIDPREEIDELRQEINDLKKLLKDKVF
jgi:hypothetical protein